MVRGFNVSNAQVNGSGDTWSEQSRPLFRLDVGAKGNAAFLRVQAQAERGGVLLP